MSANVSVAAVNSLLRSALKESVRRTGDRMVAHTTGFKVLAVVLFALFAAALVASLVFAPPELRWPTALAFGFFVLLGLALAAEAFVTRVTYDDEFIWTRSAWRRPRRIPWSAVERSDYGETNHWYRVHAGRHGIVRLSILMWGVVEFLQHLPCPHPAYPPVNALGESIVPGAFPSESEMAVSAPGHPVRVRMRSMKAMAVCVWIGALALMFLWWFDRLPDRADFVDLQGRITEIAMKKNGNRCPILELRIDTCPTLLKLSSLTTPGLAWQNFLAVAKIGTPIAATVRAEDVRNPKHPILAREPQIWIAAIQLEGRSYSTFAQHVERHRKDQALLAWFSPLLAGFGCWIWWSTQRKVRRLAEAMRADL